MLLRLLEHDAEVKVTRHLAEDVRHLSFGGIEREALNIERWCGVGRQMIGLLTIKKKKAV